MILKGLCTISNNETVSLGEVRVEIRCEEDLEALRTVFGISMIERMRIIKEGIQALKVESGRQPGSEGEYVNTLKFLF